VTAGDRPDANPSNTEQDRNTTALKAVERAMIHKF
jgi:hypothetical protein